MQSRNTRKYMTAKDTLNAAQKNTESIIKSVECEVDFLTKVKKSTFRVGK